MQVIIKRYQNRKLYNTQAKRYITFQDLEELIKQEDEVTVIDNETGIDITAKVLSQIIFETQKDHADFLPTKLLSSLVRSRGSRIEIIRQSIYNSLNIYHLYDREIERRFKLLVDNGEITQEEAEKIITKLLEIEPQPHDLLASLSNVISSYLQEQQIPTKSDMQLLIEEIDSISQRVDDLYSDKVK
jgi:polyhydroxyalkanoate synthesis repressor PhaR